MTIFDKIFLAYVAAISVVSFFAVYLDKKRAIMGRRRISEATLFVLSLLGGSAFTYFAMCLFRHKTQKNKFVFGIPLIFAVQCIVVFCLTGY